MDLDELDLERISAESLKLTGRRWAAIMAMLVREQYVDGVSARWSGNGYAEVTMSSPRITLRGLEYLQENSLMQKAANLAKGIAEIIP